MSPTPIQRNSADVAIELLTIHKELNSVTTETELLELYAKFYATAEYLKRSPNYLAPLVPEEVMKLFKK